MYVGPPQGYQQPPQQRPPPGYPGGPVAQAIVPPGYVPAFNPAQDPDFVPRGYKDAPHPGEHNFTTPELLTRYASVFVGGFVTCGIVVIWLMDPIIRIYEAILG